jgi:hypothetical protein
MQTATIKVGTVLSMGTVISINRNSITLEFNGVRFDSSFIAAEKDHEDGTIEDKAGK